LHETNNEASQQPDAREDLGEEIQVTQKQIRARWKMIEKAAKKFREVKPA